MSTQAYTPRMSNIFDTVSGMSYDEKTTWVTTLVTGGVFASYVATILGSAAGGPLQEVAYRGPLVGAIVFSVAATIVTAIVLSIAWPKDSERRDQRDRGIARLGNLVSYGFVTAGAVGALVLAFVEAPHFWIANAVYTGFALGAVAEGLTKLVAYRRGYHPR